MELGDRQNFSPKAAPAGVATTYADAAVSRSSRCSTNQRRSLRRQLAWGHGHGGNREHGGMGGMMGMGGIGVMRGEEPEELKETCPLCHARV